MIGYIYKTTNLINNRIYIGKHLKTEYDPKYYGSGKLLKLAIAKYGIQNFQNEIIYVADNVEDLNEHEKFYIKQYREQYGAEMLYNIANGGDGGDVFSGMDEKSQKDFVEKMTNINKIRCRSESFKQLHSQMMHQRYSDPNARIEQSDKMKHYWNNCDESTKQRWYNNRQSFYQSHPNYFSDIHKVPCWFEFHDIKKRFDSIGELRKYLRDEWNYTPDCRTLKKMLNDGAQGIPRTFFHKNFKRLDGMMIYLERDICVETMGDECSPVEDEISTSPKRKTEIEEIVRPV